MESTTTAAASQTYAATDNPLTNDSTGISTTDVVGQLVARFSWADYLVFSLMLLLSAGIGGIHALLGKLRGKTENTDELFTASGQMTAIPIALSLIAR